MANYVNDKGMNNKADVCWRGTTEWTNEAAQLERDIL